MFLLSFWACWWCCFFSPVVLREHACPNMPPRGLPCPPTPKFLFPPCHTAPMRPNQPICVHLTPPGCAHIVMPVLVFVRVFVCLLLVLCVCVCLCLGLLACLCLCFAFFYVSVVALCAYACVCICISCLCVCLCMTVFWAKYVYFENMHVTCMLKLTISLYLLLNITHLGPIGLV